MIFNHFAKLRHRLNLDFNVARSSLHTLMEYRRYFLVDLA